MFTNIMFRNNQFINYFKNIVIILFSICLCSINHVIESNKINITYIFGGLFALCTYLFVVLKIRKYFYQKIQSIYLQLCLIIFNVVICGLITYFTDIFNVNLPIINIVMCICAIVTSLFEFNNNIVINNIQKPYIILLTFSYIKKEYYDNGFVSYHNVILNAFIWMSLLFNVSQDKINYLYEICLYPLLTTFHVKWFISNNNVTMTNYDSSLYFIAICLLLLAKFNIDTLTKTSLLSIYLSKCLNIIVKILMIVPIQTTYIYYIYLFVEFYNYFDNIHVDEQIFKLNVDNQEKIDENKISQYIIKYNKLNE